MKKLALALLLLQPAAIFAATNKPNPADFTIVVHVVSSQYVISPEPASGYGYQQIEAVIDGQQVTLANFAKRGVLQPTDYKARQITAVGGFIPKNANGFDLFRVYELLMPDGTAREYDVVGLGPKDGSATPSTNP
ncbi:MAG: hypothetical protein WBY53_11090 [Acidobacteriaceae bacterium]